MLHLLVILSGLGPLTSVALRYEMLFPNVIVPEKIGASTHQGRFSETQVTYKLKIGDKSHTLLLEKQSFLSPNFMMYSYSEFGTQNILSSKKLDHCFYQGHSKEFPRSSVTLNICSGLRVFVVLVGCSLLVFFDCDTGRNKENVKTMAIPTFLTPLTFCALIKGILMFENVTYIIEPLATSSDNEHIIFQANTSKTDYLPLQQNQHLTQYASNFYKVLDKSEKMPDIVLRNRTLKIRIFMDKAMYDFMGSEAELAAEKVVFMFALVNSMFSQFKITIMLSSLGLWSDKNKISTNGDAEEILQRFLSWKKKDPVKRPNEISYLLIYADQPDFLGTTYYGTACDPNFAVGVVLYPKMITLEAFSVAVVQFVGINLGLNYDDLSNCYCPGTVCIMNPNAIKSSGLKFFSSCSMEDFKKSVSQPAFECLQNQKVPKVTYQGKASLCGNGILEQNEQCDCGLPKACTHKRCCNPADCTLIGYSECGSGPCCDSKTCMIASRGRLCRKSRDFCDFPEFCNGTSEFCVPDIKSADLEPCSNKTAYCLKGRCRDRDRQCLEIFGEFSKSGNYLCQEEINIHHDKFGNCREKCEFVNVFCGKLVCLWSSSDLSTPVAHDVQYMKLDGKICVSAALRNATPENENTYVEDGSTCGDKKMCQSGRCVLISTYEQKPNCDSKVKCQGHGVCNDRLNCHCDAGYSPPSCDPVPDSPGGSIDDGFWLPTRNTILSFKSQRSAPTKGLLISLYIYIPLIVIITAIALKWNTLKKFWHRDELLSGGSVSEESIITSSESWSKSH